VKLGIVRVPVDVRNVAIGVARAAFCPAPSAITGNSKKNFLRYLAPQASLVCESLNSTRTGQAISLVKKVNRYPN